MKKIFVLLSALLSTSTTAHFSTTDANADFGDNQVVTLEKINKFDLSGDQVKVGDFMPSITLMTLDLKSYDTSFESKEIKVYNILTSVDTPVCIQQAMDLSNYVSNHASELKHIKFFAISADTPFAQQRFIKEKSLEGITYLSDSSKHQFGMKTGSQIEQLGLLTRSIIVTDINNKIIHIQRVPELTTIPNLEEAVKIAKANHP